MKIARALTFMLFVAALLPQVARPQTVKSASQAPAAPAANGPAPYSTWVEDAAVAPGFIPIAKKQGAYYFVLDKEMLDTDVIETSIPSSGLGGLGPAVGDPYVAPARILRFERVDNKVVIEWRNTYATASPGSAESVGVSQGFANSIVGVVPIVAEDSATGRVAIATTTFLSDVADYAASFQGAENPMHGYTLDPQRTYLSQAKALPENDVLHVTQTWQNPEPENGDNAPDPRSLQVVMTYNLIAPPSREYVPRYEDPRVGYFSLPLVNFASDRRETRNTYYIVRWNFAPETPDRPSVASNPLVYYIASDVPLEYRDAIRRALLAWNEAFRRVGILDAIRVEDQPSDVAWDPEDIRHNMVRWVNTTKINYGAEALLVTDPRSGEEINAGINVDASLGLARNAYRFIVAPARGLPDDESRERAYVQDVIASIVLHESGHDMGLQHNFIGSTAYAAKQIQSRAFTSRMGIGSSVMEYYGLNIWPKSTPQGDYLQLVLGPYDYYAIRYGYATVPGARSPEQELGTLHTWASSWSDPRHRFASDEDVDFGSGHAIDPRVQQNDLTDDPIGWCGVQMHLMHSIMDGVGARFPSSGQPYDEARRAFVAPLSTYLGCAVMPAHTIGGEYLSRSRPGDPNAAIPLRAVPLRDELRAWRVLADGLFSDRAWHFNPKVLTMLIYSEESPLNGTSWSDPTKPRHDVSVTQIAALAQGRALTELFSPLRLQRIDDLSFKYAPRSTMSLADLFDWSYAAILGDLGSGKTGAPGVVRRNLQVTFAKVLALLWLEPEPGTPADAQALARLSLVRLQSAAGATASSASDEMTKAHAAALAAIAQQALDARAMLPSKNP